MNLVTRFLVGSFAGFCRQEELGAMLGHPRTNTQFRFAVTGRRVDMVDAILKQQIKRIVGFFLRHVTECCCTKYNACTEMTCSAKCKCWNHTSSPISPISED